MLRRLASDDRSHLRVMVLAAHPADESLGAAGLLSRLTDPWVVCLTDGAPRDRRFVPKGVPSSPSGYAKRRRQELRAALALAGVGLDRVLQLDVPDQEAALSLCKLVHRLATLARGLRPHLLVTHGYEGGHPDHDAAAFVAQAACALIERRGGIAPRRFEMTSYHVRNGTLETGRFLQDGPMLELPVEGPARARKEAMIRAYASQAQVLAPFHLDVERYRLAPIYDFTVRPHEGPTHYDRLGWAMNSERFCALAQEAAFELGAEEVRWA